MVDIERTYKTLMISLVDNGEEFPWDYHWCKMMRDTSSCVTPIYN